MSIWDKLKKPIFILAPMEDVTDTVFRQIILQTGRPDLFFTEFTNVDGLESTGHDHVAKRLQFVKKEKPLIAQIWGMKPENYFATAKKIGEMGFDGIDINMGCPQHDVTSHGACSALIKNHTLATEIITATQEGARSASSGQADLPVSVKTRIGFSGIQTEEWIGFLLEHNLSALTVHGRTVKEMSKVPAHWDEIGKAAQIRNAMEVKTLIIGNGDVESLEEAKEKTKQYGLDGIMIGRGIFHNPWIFREDFDLNSVTLKQRVQLLLDHVELYEKTWGSSKKYPPLKKYFKIYLSGFDGAAEIRTKFMETNTPDEGIRLAKEMIHSF